MILTDKSKTDFLKWYFEKGNKKINSKEFSLDIAKVIQNALIIEWFDSVGIYLNIENLYYQSWWSFKVKNCPVTYEEKIMVKTRSEATKKAIEKSNEIYNNLNTKENKK